jgi:hypothetical protein
MGKRGQKLPLRILSNSELLSLFEPLGIAGCACHRSIKIATRGKSLG